MLEFMKNLGAGVLEESYRAVPEYKEYESVDFNLPEALRYAGMPAHSAPQAGKDAVFDALEEIGGDLFYKVGFLCMYLQWDEEGFPVLPFAQHSELLKKNLRGCEGVILFAATIGSGVDRYIRRYERSEVSKAAILQGLGAERVESLCNCFNEEVKRMASENHLKAHPRFSPGFGDLPISVQKEFLGALDATRRMGITLSESFLMAPSKSVTAIIGLERIPDNGGE